MVHKYWKCKRKTGQTSILQTFLYVLVEAVKIIALRYKKNKSNKQNTTNVSAILAILRYCNAMLLSTCCQREREREYHPHSFCLILVCDISTHRGYTLNLCTLGCIREKDEHSLKQRHDKENDREQKDREMGTHLCIPNTTAPTDTLKHI